jgi:hypothetical protein
MIEQPSTRLNVRETRMPRGLTWMSRTTNTIRRVLPRSGRCSVCATYAERSLRPAGGRASRTVGYMTCDTPPFPACSEGS